MAQRPKYINLWAESAAPEDIGDADVYVPQNPAYPEQTTNQYLTGWYVSPLNDLVKQPHQWINSWAYTVDLAILEAMQSGPTYDATVTYRKGGMVNANGVWWAAKSDGQLPAPNVTQWSKTQFTDVDELQASLAGLNATQTAHEGRRDNPHNVTTTQIDAYTTAQTDQKVTVVQTDWNTHKARTDNPHQVSYAQINCLPTTGGSFLGVVTLSQMVLNGGATIALLSGTFGSHKGGKSFGISPTQGWAIINQSLLLADTNYAEIRARNTRGFLVPPPELHLPLRRDLYSLASGYGDIEYTGTPVFEAAGLKRVASDSLTVSPAPTGTVIAVVDGVVTAKTGSLSTNLLSHFSGANIRDLKLWSAPLSEEQCQHLGVTVWQL